MGRNRAQVVAITIATILMIAPVVAETPLDLSAGPPKAGPSLSLGRVGPDLCPGCRTEQSGVYNFITQKRPPPHRAGARNSAEHPARQSCALNPIPVTRCDRRETKGRFQRQTLRHQPVRSAGLRLAAHNAPHPEGLPGTCLSQRWRRKLDYLQHGRR